VSGDDAIFDGTSIKDCILDDAVSGVAIGVMAGHTGTITQGVLSMTLTSYTQAGGTFVGGGGDITVETFSLSGGSFTSTSGNLTVPINSYAISGGTFSHNGGTVTAYSVAFEWAYFDAGGAVLNNLTIDSQYATAFASAVDLDGNCVLQAVGQRIELAGYALNVGGNLTITGQYFYGDGTMTFDGAGAQALDCGGHANTYFQNVTVNKASGTLTVVNSDPVLNGNLDVQSGTLDLGGRTARVSGNFTNTGTAGLGLGTLVLDGTDQTISGTSTFDKLTKTVTSPATLTFEAGMTQTVTGTLMLKGSIGNLLSLRSSASPTQWLIDPQGARDLICLDVQDSNNVNAVTIDVIGTGSTDSGNNTNWWFYPPPGAFSLLTPTDASTDVSAPPTLDWEDAVDVTTYTLLVDDDPAFASPEVDDATLTSGTYTVDSGVLSPNVTYYWRVTAVNSFGSTPASNNDFSFTTEETFTGLVGGGCLSSPDHGFSAAALCALLAGWVAFMRCLRRATRPVGS
jgi:hypothetical protein